MNGKYYEKFEIDLQIDSIIHDKDNENGKLQW